LGGDGRVVLVVDDQIAGGHDIRVFGGQRVDEALAALDMVELRRHAGDRHLAGADQRGQPAGRHDTGIVVAGSHERITFAEGRIGVKADHRDAGLNGGIDGRDERIRVGDRRQDAGGLLASDFLEHTGLGDDIVFRRAGVDRLDAQECGGVLHPAVAVLPVVDAGGKRNHVVGLLFLGLDLAEGREQARRSQDTAGLQEFTALHREISFFFSQTDERTRNATHDAYAFLRPGRTW